MDHFRFFAILNPMHHYIDHYIPIQKYYFLHYPKMHYPIKLAYKPLMQLKLNETSRKHYKKKHPIQYHHICDILNTITQNSINLAIQYNWAFGINLSILNIKIKTFIPLIPPE